MKLSIFTKLFIAMLSACALTLAVNGVAARFSFERAFLNYLNEQSVQRMQQIAVLLAGEYRAQGSWEFMRGNPGALFDLLRPPPRGNVGQVPDRPPPLFDQTGLMMRLAVLDEQGRRIFGNPSAAREGSIRIQVAANGHGVGWLAMVPLEQAVEDGDVRFYQTHQRAMWVNIGASIIVAALLAWLLSRALLRPLQILTGSIRKLAAGDYSIRISGPASDELGRLMRDVNRLADVLNRTEQSRRDFMADISHELRTPLSVLRAELEAIQDGIRSLQPGTLALLQAQVQQLGKLVDDLHELSAAQADQSYQLVSLDVVAALDAAVASMGHRFADAGLALHMDLHPMPLLIQAEERRLQQLFVNLLENSTRYTDRGGRVRVSVQRGAGNVLIAIEDSAPGVPDDKLPRLFERFYRVETSRSRVSGGSGLGLAICEGIAHALRGEIRAEASSLGGLRIVITFPLMP